MNPISYALDFQRSYNLFAKDFLNRKNQKNPKNDYFQVKIEILRNKNNHILDI